MKNRESIFLAKYIISAYDGEVSEAAFSTLDKAREYCDKSDEDFIENPLNDNCGWLIEEHILNQPNKIKFYNQKGTQIEYEPPEKRTSQKIK